MNNKKLMNLNNLLSKCYIGRENNVILNRPEVKIIISGTHNNRLECFFNKYILKSKHFNNCATIRIYNNTEGSNKVCVSLIYTGDHNDESYWLLEEFNKQFTNKEIIDVNLPENTEIFLVRHGKGVHNSTKGDSLLDKIYNGSIKDPSLDITGVEQAKSVGKFLNGYINNNYKNYKIYFTASHLIRTQQTVGLIMEQMNRLEHMSISIAPCTHELIYIPNIDCDCSLLQNIPLKTNTPNCNIDNICPFLTKYCHTECYNTNPIPLNWDYYKLFYNSNEKCCSNNMLNQIIRTVL